METDGLQNTTGFRAYSFFTLRIFIIVNQGIKQHSAKNSNKVYLIDRDMIYLQPAKVYYNH